jgi:5'-nucleotidase
VRTDAEHQLSSLIVTRGIRTAVLIAALLILVASVVQFAQVSQATVPIQILAFNDFHGGLEPVTGGNGRVGSVEAGGVEYLAAHLARYERDTSNTLTVSAGDNIGASPFLSSLFHDEPSIEALTLAGLDLSALGNHELDEGWWELYRIQRGGCHPVDGCQDGTPYAGAPFPYLAANVVLDPQRADPKMLALAGIEGTEPRPLLPAYAIREVGGVRVGVIGLILQEAPSMILPTATRGLIFEAEAPSVNKAAAELRAKGIRAIVVIMHEGGDQEGTDPNGCDQISTDLTGLATAISDDVDVIVSGHSHQAYNCTIDGKLVTSAASAGRIFTDIDLEVRRSDGEVVSKTARNVIVTRDVDKHPALTSLLAGYRPAAEKVSNRVIGTITGSLTRVATPAGESVMGDVVADALLYAARKTPGVDADLAVWNSGGVRADLVMPPGVQSAPITYGQSFSVLPFGNELITKSLTGEKLIEMLEEQFGGAGGTGDRVRILQVSEGFTYSYDSTRPFGQRIDRSSIRLNGKPIDPAMTYRLATSNYLWDGGDDQAALREGRDAELVGVDYDVLADYFVNNSPVRPPAANRIHKIR